MLVLTAAAHAVDAAVHPHDLNAGAPGGGAATIGPGQLGRTAAPGHDRQGLGAVAAVDDGDQLVVAGGGGAPSAGCAWAIEAAGAENRASASPAFSKIIILRSPPVAIAVSAR